MATDGAELNSREQITRIDRERAEAAKYAASKARSKPPIEGTQRIA
jgi:hypothetical protein